MSVPLGSLCVAAALADHATGLLESFNEKFGCLVVQPPPVNDKDASDADADAAKQEQQQKEGDSTNTNTNTAMHTSMPMPMPMQYEGKTIWDLLGLEAGFTGELEKPIYQAETAPNKWVRIHISTMEREGATPILLAQVENVDSGMRAKDQWTAILETSFDGFWDYHCDKDYEYMSPRFWEMFGYDASEKEHKPSEWMDMIHQEDLKASLEDLNRHFQSKGEIPYIRETRYRHKQGHWVWVLCRGRVIEWDENTGAPLRMIGTHTDITESKTKEIKERELYAKIEREHKLVIVANEELRRFVQYVNAPVFGVDTQGIINVWNDCMERITNIPQKEIVGKPLDASSVKSAQEMVQNALRGEEVTNALLDVMVQKIPESDGCKALKLLVNTTTRRNLDQEVLGCFCLGLDITQVQLANEKYLKERERVAAEKNINEFVAHEVRNPLSAAISATQFIVEGLKEIEDSIPASRKSLQKDAAVVSSSLDYIHQLLTSMLDLNKFLEKDISLVARTVDLKRDIVEPVYFMYSHRMEKLQISFEAPDNECIRVDDLRLKQVIINLTSNAVKFTKEGFVRIKVGRFDGTNPDMVVIMVEDSGAGIPEEKRVLLFERYVQLSRQVQGSGLGLCLTLHLVEAMNGTIELDDTYNSGMVDHPGTRFVVKIPLPHINKLDDTMSATTTNKVSKRDRSDSEIAVTNNIKVLVVDDDKLIRRLVIRRLQNIDKSMVIEQAENGEQAIAMIVGPDASDFDLVLVDHYMPLCGGELTGTETIAKIRPHVTGIIIGSSGNNMSQEHTAAGADLFWQKPIPKNDILIQDLQGAFRGKMASI